MNHLYVVLQYLCRVMWNLIKPNNANKSRYLSYTKLGGPPVFGLSVLLASGRYLYAASRVGMPGEAHEARPVDGFHALLDSHFNGMI